jgi:DNA polymerase-3 subunit gamma/tau
MPAWHGGADAAASHQPLLASEVFSAPATAPAAAHATPAVAASAPAVAAPAPAVAAPAPVVAEPAPAAALLPASSPLLTEFELARNIASAAHA